MAELLEHKIEEELIRYVKGEDELWHWLDSCPGYPQGDKRIEYESHAVIPSGELCRHCLSIELKMSLESVLIEA